MTIPRRRCLHKRRCVRRKPSCLCAVHGPGGPQIHTPWACSPAFPTLCLDQTVLLYAGAPTSSSTHGSPQRRHAAGAKLPAGFHVFVSFPSGPCTQPLAVDAFMVMPVSCLLWVPSISTLRFNPPFAIPHLLAVVHHGQRRLQPGRNVQHM